MFWAVIGIGIPAFAIALFNALNQLQPRHDEAQYFILAQEHLINFKQSGIWEGLKGLYFLRLWKPTAFGLFNLPFLILSNENLRVAAALLETTIAITTLSCTYLIMKRFLSEKKAALVVCFLGFSSWFSQFSHICSAQMPFLAALSLCILLFIRWQQEKRPQFAIGFFCCAAFSMMLRPIETATITFIPLLFLCYQSLKAKNHLRMIAIATSTIISIFLALPILSNPIKIALYFLFFLAAALLIRRKFRSNPELPELEKSWIVGLLIFCALVNGWYLLFYDKLFAWAFTGAYSPLIKLFSGRSTGDHLEFFQRLLRMLFGIPGLLFLTAALLGLDRSRLKTEVPKMILVGATALLPFFLCTFSSNSSHWFAFNGAYIGTLGLGFWALTDKGRFKNFRLAICTVVVLYSFQSSSSNFVPQTSSFNGNLFLEKDPAIQLTDDLLNMLKPAEPLTIGIVPYRGTHNSLFLSLDRFFLQAYANQEKSLLANFDSFDNDDYLETLRTLLQHCHYLVVGPIGEFEISNKAIPMSQLANHLEKTANSSELKKLGLQYLGTLPISGLKGENGRVMIFENLPRFSKQ